MTKVKNNANKSRNDLYMPQRQDEVIAQATSPYWPKTLVHATQTDLTKNVVLLSEVETIDKPVN